MVSDILLYCTFIIGLIVDHCSMPIHKYSEKDFTIHELIEIRVITNKISQQPENCENRNDPDLVEMVG